MVDCVSKDVKGVVPLGLLAARADRSVEGCVVPKMKFRNTFYNTFAAQMQKS